MQTDDVAIVLVRHGETEWSSSGQHTSFTDIPLTERGDARRRDRWRDGWRTFGFALVLTSPRSARASRPARSPACADRAEVTDDLAEWNYGDYEGRTTDEIRRERPGLDDLLGRRARRRDAPTTSPRAPTA